MNDIIYNQEKTKVLNENDYDLKNGYLKDDTITIHHDKIIGQEEEGHYETIAEYENGGKDVEWIIDKPYIESIEAYDEEIQIKVFIPYSKEELRIRDIQVQISENKRLLFDSDYKAIKYAEGLYTEEEYSEIKEYRQELRNSINDLEKELSELGG